MVTTEQAREYERKYHEELYGSHALFEPGTWLYKPAGYATNAFKLVPMREHVRVLDLGGGVGRHSIPAAQFFGSSSEVICVDLLNAAIERLRLNARRHGVESNVAGIASDIENFDLSDEPYNLILSVSCIEHIPGRQRLEEFMERLQKATAPGGVHCFMIITNNEWIDADSDQKLPPLIEQNLSSDEAAEMLNRLYDRWKVHDISTKDWQATQPMNGKDVILKSTCVQFTAQKSV